MKRIFSSRHADSARPLTRLLTHAGGIMALVVLLVATGAGVTYALWTSSATTGSTAKGGQLSVSASFSGLAGFEFQNHAPTVNGTITVANTTAGSTASMPVSSKLSAVLSGTGVDSSWASRFAVRMWPQSAAVCTSPTLPATGVQGDLNTIPAIAGAVAPGQSIVYCLRITAAAHGLVGAAGGSLTITPKITATLSYNSTSTWTAATAPTIAQATKSIYPIATPSTSDWFRISNATGSTAGNNCIDVDSATDTDGQAVIGYGCKENSDSGKVNQRWRLVADGSYYRIVTKLASGNGIAVSGASTASGAAVVMNTALSNAALWQAQTISTNVYQFVNKNSGMCLTRGIASGGVTPYLQTACAGSSSQNFFLTADGAYSNPIADPAVTLSCVQSGNDVTIGWGSTTSLPYTISRSYSSNGSGPTEITTGVTAASYTVTPGNWTNGPLYLRVGDGTNFKQIQVTKSSSGFFWFMTHTLSCP